MLKNLPTKQNCLSGSGQPDRFKLHGGGSGGCGRGTTGTVTRTHKNAHRYGRGTTGTVTRTHKNAHRHGRGTRTGTAVVRTQLRAHTKMHTGTAVVRAQARAHTKICGRWQPGVASPINNVRSLPC